MPSTSPRGATERAHKALADVLTEIDAELATIVSVSDEQIQRIRRRVREETASLRSRRREVERALSVLTGSKAPARRTPRDVAADSRRVAGPAAITAVTEYLERAGSAFQIDIARETGLNSGTITHVLRVLGSEGKIEMTGEKRMNSPEVRWIGAKSARRTREPVAA